MGSFNDRFIASRTSPAFAECTSQTASGTFFSNFAVTITLEPLSTEASPGKMIGKSLFATASESIAANERERLGAFNKAIAITPTQPRPNKLLHQDIAMRFEGTTTCQPLEKSWRIASEITDRCK